MKSNIIFCIFQTLIVVLGNSYGLNNLSKRIFQTSNYEKIHDIAADTYHDMMSSDDTWLVQTRDTWQEDGEGRAAAGAQWQHPLLWDGGPGPVPGPAPGHHQDRARVRRGRHLQPLHRHVRRLPGGCLPLVSPCRVENKYLVSGTHVCDEDLSLLPDLFPDQAGAALHQGAAGHRAGQRDQVVRAPLPQREPARAGGVRVAVSVQVSLISSQSRQN